MTRLSELLIGVAVVSIMTFVVIGMISMMNADQPLSEVMSGDDAALASSQIVKINSSLNKLDALSSTVEGFNIIPGESKTTPTSLIDRMWEGVWKALSALGNVSNFVTGSFSMIFSIFDILEVIGIPSFVIIGIELILTITVLFIIISFIGRWDL